MVAALLSPLRFIPTCMGNSFTRYPHTSISSVHPHVHGELCPSPFLGHIGHGSSPRAWGTPIQDTRFLLEERFIPTCMGNSMFPTPGRKPGTVHPHVHGELS